MSDTFHLDLVKPVIIGEGDKAQSYDALDLCEPTGAQMEKAANTTNPVTSNLILIAEVSSVPLAVVRRMCQRDIEAATDFLKGFMAPGPQTGAS